MNVFVQYFAERRRRLSRLSLVRWWLTEYLGRGLISIALGALVLGIIPDSIRTSITFGMLFVGGLVMVLSYGWRQPSIEVLGGVAHIIYVHHAGMVSGIRCVM